MDHQRLDHLAVFENLTEGEKRMLAGVLDEKQVPEGENVVTEGEYGYEFMVIESGSVDVVYKGDKVDEMGPGDFFGEVAVLSSGGTRNCDDRRDEPRDGAHAHLALHARGALAHAACRRTDRRSGRPARPLSAGETMTSVREATFELFRREGMTTIFGNPGSTELPMLADYPDDFRYVLGLQEAVAVGMADGYAQASGRVTHVNLHTAPGLGNGVGAIYNAFGNKSPLLVTAGQQIRSFITQQASLTNRDATEVPQPFVKWSHEPPRVRGRSVRDRPGDPPREPAAARTRVRVDTDGRLAR